VGTGRSENSFGYALTADCAPDPRVPTIVSPPPAGAAGAWSVTADEEGVKSLFHDATGKLLGFALNGKATAERAALTQQLPPVLA